MPQASKTFFVKVNAQQASGDRIRTLKGIGGKRSRPFEFSSIVKAVLSGMTALHTRSSVF
jgi:hypothetical protein